MLAAISPMIAWAVYFVAVYALQGLGCELGWHRLPLPGTNALTVVLAALTLAALAAIAWAGWRGWRRRTAFEGRLALVLAVLAAIATAYSGITVVMLAPCAA